MKPPALDPFALSEDAQGLLFEMIESEPEAPAEWLASKTADPQLAEHLLALFRAHQDSITDPHQPLRDARERMLDQAISEAMPERVGNWQLLRVLGHGGMSTVFLARRESSEFEQLAAIKLLAGGPGVAAMAERFANERRILARLEHPNIARLIDGGVSDHGLPYFVMEYADGVDVLGWCEQQRLSIDQRLGLVLQILDVLGYAHRNLVVHRDLKPSNILVTNDGQVKLLDFGIAKAIDEVVGAGDDTELTRLAGRPMTPAWASPEQVSGAPITVASDLYSVGLLLYRLLSGCSPYTQSPDDLNALQQAIVNQTPTAPSRLALSRQAADDGLPTANEKLRRRLRGDLDTIVLTCLRKEPERRYASCDQLAEDIRRHLSSRPIQARPDRWTYRSGKFLLRNRLPVALLSLSLAISVIGIATHTQRLAAERDRAESAAELARTEATKAGQIAEYLVELFRSADPTAEADQDLTAADLLMRGIERIDQLHDSPLVRIELLRVFGGVFEARGEHQQAIELYQRALQELTLMPAAEELAMQAQLEVDLAFSLFNSGQIERAGKTIESALSRLDESRPTALAQALNIRANLARDSGELMAAEGDYRRALVLFQREQGVDADTSTVMINLGTVLTIQRRFKEAQELYRQALDYRRQSYGPEHPWTTIPEGNLAWILMETGALEEARELYERALDLRRQSLGDRHPRLAIIHYQLGQLQLKRGDPDAAEPHLQIAFDIFANSVGEAHRHTTMARLGLGELALRRGQLDQAELWLVAALEAFQSIHPGPHSDISRTLKNLGQLYQQAGRAQLALQHFEQALAISQELPGQVHELIDAWMSLARFYLSQGGKADAIAALEAAERLLDSQAEPLARQRTELVLLAASLDEAS